MPAPDRPHYRRLCPADVGRLEGKDFKVHRDVYVWLTCGPDSTMTSLCRASVAQLSEQLGWSAANVRAALQDLHDMGLIVWTPDKSLVYCHGLTRDPPQNHDHQAKILREIDRYVVCAASAEAREIATGRSYTVPKRVSNTVPDTTGSRMQDAGDRNQESGSSQQDLPADAGAPVAPTPTRTDKRVDELIAAYNEARQGRMPQCAGTELQRKDIAAALKRDPVPIWIARIQRACKSSLLKGDKGDWRADLSWILKPRNAEKIDAGNYDDSGPTVFALAGPRGNAPAKPEGRDDTDHLLKMFGVSHDQDNH